MNKTAQQRQWYNKLHEAVSSPVSSMKKIFQPEFKKVMDSLIQKDDTIRSILLGKKVSRNIMPEFSFENVSVKDLLSKAKTYISQREYISAVSVLSRFHKKMQDVSKVIDSLNLDVNKIHHQFLFGGKVPEKKYMEHLSDLEQRIAADELEFMIKQAGIVDLWKNHFTPRGRSLRTWEKNYEDRVKQFRDGALAQLEAAQNLVSTVLEHLKVMASLRAAGRIDAYVDEAKVIKSAFQAYDNGKDGFRNFYNNVIKPEVDAQRKLQKEQEETRKPAEVPSLPPADVPAGASVDQSPFVDKSSVPMPLVNKKIENLDTDRMPKGLDTDRIPAPPSVPKDMPLVPRNLSMPPAPGQSEPKLKSDIIADEVAAKLFGPKQASYQTFINSLQVYAAEDPAVLAAHINRYAKTIQGDQPEIALKLFKIAKSLRG